MNRISIKKVRTDTAIVKITRSKLKYVREKIESFLTRRPHRSFRLTKRRDYIRSLQLPGYTAFSFEVFAILRRHKILFLKVILLYAVLGALFVGFSSQSTYAELSNILDDQDLSSLSEGWTIVTQASTLLFIGLSGGVNAEVTDIQQVYSLLIFLLTWLTTVWLLRSILANQKPKLRDGLYNAGAPIIPTGAVLLVLTLQMIPAAAGVILYSAAASSGVLADGFTSMVAGLGAALLSVLSAYWTVSTFIALVIVTLPGMYPLQALRSAGDIVVGRRLRILFRLLWMIIGNVVAIVVVVLPLVLFDKWIKDMFEFFTVIPFVSIGVTLLSSVLVVWSAAYVYILYRKVVEDDASPA